MIYRYYIDSAGLIEEISPYSGRRRCIPFPVCLAIEHREDLFEVCPDFLLSPGQETVLIRTEAPLPKGSKVRMRFFIPPESKLLGVFKGKVIESRKGNQAIHEGMRIKLTGSTREEMQHLQNFLQGEKPLIDLVT